MSQTSSFFQIKFDNIIFGFNQDGLAYSDCNDKEMKENILQNKNNYDPKETSWFKDTLLMSDNYNINNNLQNDNYKNPMILLEDGMYYSKQICQQSMNFSNLSNELSHVSCINIGLKEIQDYFKNFVNSSTRQFIVQPISQTILFDSFNNSSQINSNFTSQEFKDQSIDQQLYQNSTNQIQRNCQQLYRTLDKIELAKVYFQPVLSQKINNLEKVILINPIYIIDKFIPNDSLDGKFLYQLKIAFLHNTIFSIESLEGEQNDLQSIYQDYFIIICILMTIIAIISIFITLIYSIKVQQMFDRSINHLIDILNIIQEEIQHMESINNYDFQEEFLSYETHELFQSFKELFHILLYTSENFYKDNSTETLLKLHKNVEFFKQFGFYQAIGITYNNIGSIFLQQGHYFQAMEQFQNAIIYAKYQISDYCKLNPEQANSDVLAQYCFDKVQVNQNSSINSQHKNQDKQQPIQIVSRHLTQIYPNATNSSFSSNQIKKFSTPEALRQLPTKISSVTRQQQYQQLQQKKIEELNIIEIELLTTLFYRKRNYIYSILEFQEFCDEKSTSSYYCDQYDYNFWQEIKVLLKKLLRLARLLPLSQQFEIGILSHIAKCQFQLGKSIKSLQTLDKCDILLKQLQSGEYREKNDSMHKAIPNTQQSYILDSDQLKAEILKSSQSRQNVSDSITKYRNSIFMLPSIDRRRTSTVNTFHQQRIINLNEKKEKIKPSLANQENINRIKEYSCEFQRKRDNSYQCEFQNKSQYNLNQIQLNLFQKQQFKNSNIQYNQHKKQSLRRDTQKSIKQSTFIQIKAKQQFLSSQSFLNKKEKQMEDLSDLEIYFENQRKNQSLLQDDTLAMNYVSADTLDSKVKYTLAEYFLQNNDYREAALILTNLLENKKMFMSHFPRKILDLLRQIMIQLDAQCQEFYKIYNKFNPNISINITMIFSCSNNNQSISKSLQLASNLVSNTLTQKKDQFGLILVNEQENQVQTYMPQILTSQIKGMMGKVLQDIQNVVSSQQTKYLFEQYDTLLTNNIDQEDKGFKEDRVFVSQESKNKIFQNSAAIQTTTLNDSYYNQDHFPQQFDNNLYPNKIEDSIINKCNNSFLNESNVLTDSEFIQQSPNNAIIKEDNWVAKNSKINQLAAINKMQEINGDNDQININIFDNQNEKNKILNGEDSNKLNNKNYYFHMSIRKAIQDMFLQKADYLQVKNAFSNKNYQSNIQRDYQNPDQQQKFLIYCTDLVEVTQNNLLNNLFTVLYQFDIQLIIYSVKKGNNFLENLPYQTYQHQNKEIVRIFYSNTKLINYLTSQRDIFSKCAYPTIIQHY